MRLFFLALALFLAASTHALCQCQTYRGQPIHRAATCHTPYAHAVPVTPVIAVVKEVLIPTEFAFQYTPVLFQQTTLVTAPAPGQITAQPGEMVFRLPEEVTTNTMNTAGGNAGIQVLRNRCASCHTTPGKYGVDLFDVAGNFSPNVPTAQLKNAARTGRMPKGGLTDPTKRLTPGELAAVEALP